MPPREVVLAAPYRQQAQFLRLLAGPELDRDAEITIAHFVGGRGTGKTHCSAYALLQSALTINRGLPHLWTVPVGRDSLDISLRAWQEAVPDRALWRWRPSERQIVVLAGTTTPTPIDLRSRQREAGAAREPFRGQTYAAAVHDELARDPDRLAWDLARATIRHPRAGRLWMASTSTPRLGWYRDLVYEAPSSHVLHATSYDNPYLGRGYARGLERSLSERYARQEVHGEWIAQDGLVWPSALPDVDWPEGNRHWHRYDRTRPWILAGDIGLRSAWIAVQTVQPLDRHGRRVERHPPVDVVVAQWCTDTEGAQQTLARIELAMGSRPAHVILGADATSRSVADAEITPAVVLRNRGWTMPLTTVTSPWSSKRIQHMVADGLVANVAGHRQIAISSECTVHGNAARSLAEVWRCDTWPSSGDTLLAKDKSSGGPGLEDMRDAWLYYSVITHPPVDYGRPQAAVV